MLLRPLGDEKLVMELLADDVKPFGRT